MRVSTISSLEHKTKLNIVALETVKSRKSGIYISIYDDIRLYLRTPSKDFESSYRRFIGSYMYIYYEHYDKINFGNVFDEDFQYTRETVKYDAGIDVDISENKVLKEVMVFTIP